MDGIDFLKMHGLGNDFVILDARARDIPLDPEAIRRIADRHFGVGCDQLIRLEPSDRADVFMRIWNPDGSEAEACGNATRCVARLLMAEEGHRRIAIETVAGLLEGREKDGTVTIDMGTPQLGWQDIPLDKFQKCTSACRNIGNTVFYSIFFYGRDCLTTTRNGKPGISRNCLGNCLGAIGKFLEFKNPDRAVPENGPRNANSTGKIPGSFRANVENHIIISHISDGLHPGFCSIRKFRSHYHIQRQGNVGPAHQGLCLIDHVLFTQRLSHQISRRCQEGIGDASTHDKMIHPG
jgi:hypothetical protein